MSASDPLAAYHRKRDFARTSEPEGEPEPVGEAPVFVIQKHDARTPHYDFRLAWDGVMWSWAVPKGPNDDPQIRRLAVRTEDHPLAYASFEGLIPEGEYGAGAVVVWDRGTWEPIGDPAAGLSAGKIAFTLHGERCRGEWRLVRTGRGPGSQDTWFLLKKGAPDTGVTGDLAALHRTSVLSGRTTEDIRRGVSPPALVVPGDVQPIPADLVPELPTAAERAPDGWLHEVKHDGYRVLAQRSGGVTRITTRRGHDWTDRFRPIARAVEALPVSSVVLDGEVVVRGADGRSDFQALQQALALGRGDLHFIAFNLLHLDGHDLRALPLRQRKELLEALISRGGPTLSYSGHLVAPFAQVLAQVRALGLEGVVSKDPEAPSRPGRSKSWLKVKCRQTDTFPVVGYTEADDGGVAALRLGQRSDPQLDGGGVGTGFDHATRVRLRSLLAPLAVGRRRRDGVQPVQPTVMVEVEFAGITDAGHVRHGVYRGVRDDLMGAALAPIDAVAAIVPSEAARAAVGRLRITNPDRVFWPDLGITKAETIAYYATIAERVLPGLVGRPLAVVRCPEGVGGPEFFQKHWHSGFPPGVGVTDVPGEHDPQLTIQSLDGLLGLVQMSVLEFHPWGARNGQYETPDRLIWDLDPDEALSWEPIAETALRLRARLETLGLRSFVRTTGGKGLHVVVPMRPTLPWDTARAFATQVATSLQRETPGLIVLTPGKHRRVGKIFVDVLRNARGATAVGSWSTRARPGGKIAVPLRWDEVPTVGPSPWDVRSIWARLAVFPEDPWAAIDTVEQEVDPTARTG